MNKITLAHQLVGVQSLRNYIATRGADSDPRIEAAVATLQWMADNEPALRAVAADLASIRHDPAVAKILATWPGAVITRVASRDEDVP